MGGRGSDHSFCAWSLWEGGGKKRFGILLKNYSAYTLSMGRISICMYLCAKKLPSMNLKHKVCNFTRNKHKHIKKKKKNTILYHKFNFTYKYLKRLIVLMYLFAFNFSYKL